MIPSNFGKYLCGFLLLSAFVSRNLSVQGWMEVVSPHFRVLTNSNAANGRELAGQFEQMRHVFVTEFHDESIGEGVPLTIVAAQDEQTFKELEPQLWKASSGNVDGVFSRGWEKQFAAVMLNSSGLNDITVLHEYTHSVMHTRAHWLPFWLSEGLAEFYSYTRFEHGRTLIGLPTVRVTALQTTLVPVSEMLAMNDTSQLWHDQRRIELAYAESWAIVHFMMFGEGMDSGAKLNSFIQKLQAGERQQTAFQEVFGDPKAFDKGLEQYLVRISLTAGVLPPDPKVEEKTFVVRKLTPAETEYELGSFQIGMHEGALGHARIEKALVLDPKLAGAHEELAYWKFRLGDDEDAVKEWQQAVDLDPKRARSIFSLAMMGVPLRSQTPPQLLGTQAILEHVIELAPGFAAPYVELGLVDWRLGNLQKAYEAVAKAEKLEPWRAGYHVLSGRILLAGKQPALAAKSARFVADRWNGPDHNEAVDLWEMLPVAERGEPSLTLEVARGAKVERGMLTELTCANGSSVPAVITLTPDTPGAAPVTFKSDGRFMVGFSDSFWWGDDHFTSCHHMTGHRAMIVYKPEDRHVLDVEVRDDLPSPTKANAPATASAH